MTKVLLIFFLLLFFTLPLFAQVDVTWVRRYNGPGNYHDEAYAIAIDGSGNVYVTGRSYDSETSYDYATIKYYPNGETAWVRRYDGPGNGDDWAFAIAVDGYGNVYVTGGSGSDTDPDKTDYATIKYDSLGSELWVRRYNGPGNSWDDAFAIAVDDWGNVYVTGRSAQVSGVPSNYDYATIKYYPNGDTAWLRRYNGPYDYQDCASAIAIDGSGNVHVTGDSHGGMTAWDYATIKYDSIGNQLWVRRYDGPGKSHDYPHAIDLDASGNVYITGQSVGIETNYDYATIKYYPNGDTVWVRRYNGPTNFWDEARAIAVDASGDNVCVTGASAQNSSYPWIPDYRTIKYDSKGNQLWVTEYNGPGDAADSARAIALDASGNVYVTGLSVGSGTSYDYATIKYDPVGNQVWVRRYNGPGNDIDDARAIAVDDFGAVYVTGQSVGSGTNYDYVTIKYVGVPVCGDVNGNGVVDGGDVVYLINYLYIGGPPPPDAWTADVNHCDERIDSADIIYLINYLYIGGPPPACCEW
jgi:hypothetical protein